MNARIGMHACRPEDMEKYQWTEQAQENSDVLINNCEDKGWILMKTQYEKQERCQK